MEKKIVFLNDRISPNAVRRLQEKVELVRTYEHPEELDAIIVRQEYCKRDVIEKASKCKLIQMHGVGLDRIDTEAAKEYGIPVLTTAGSNAQSVAELTVSLILALSKKLKYVSKGVQAGRFSRFGLSEVEGIELFGKTIGLVGSGHIAQCTAKILKNGFNCRILCYNPHLSKEKAANLGYELVNTLNELVSRSDVVTIHIPLNSDTRHMFNNEVFAAAQPGLILINTSRGGIVDEEALYEALCSGKICGAALDVFEHEPPSKDHPLLSLDNFIGTMHIGGSTSEALDRAGDIIVHNVFSYLGIEE